jgi:hypothetical protein
VGSYAHAGVRDDEVRRAEAADEILGSLFYRVDVRYVRGIGDDGPRQVGGCASARDEGEDRGVTRIMAGQRLPDAGGGAGDDDAEVIPAGYFCLRTLSTRLSMACSMFCWALTT